MMARLAKAIERATDDGSNHYAAELTAIKDAFAVSNGAFARATQIGGNLFVFAYSPEMEGYDVSERFLDERLTTHGTYRYHSHSEWYELLLSQIKGSGETLPLFAPEFEFVRKNGSGIERVEVLSNFVDATQDATVFVEFNVLPHLLKGATKPNHPFAVFVKAIEATKLTTNKGCGMHIHFSTAAAANTINTIYNRLVNMDNVSEGYQAAAQFALWDRSKYYGGATFSAIRDNMRILKNESVKNIDAFITTINDLPLSARKKAEAINNVTAKLAKDVIDNFRGGGHSELYHKTGYGTFEFRCAKCTSIQTEYLLVLRNVLAFLGLRELTETERKTNRRRLLAAYEARELENAEPAWNDLF